MSEEAESSQPRPDWRKDAGVPRRICLDLNTPTELAVRAAMKAVEDAGAHPLLTDAIVLLQQSFEKVADYTDNPNFAPSSVVPSPLVSPEDVAKITRTCYEACRAADIEQLQKPWDHLSPSEQEPYVASVIWIVDHPGENLLEAMDYFSKTGCALIHAIVATLSGQDVSNPPFAFPVVQYTKDGFHISGTDAETERLTAELIGFVHNTIYEQQRRGIFIVPKPSRESEDLDADHLLQPQMPQILRPIEVHIHGLEGLTTEEKADALKRIISELSNTSDSKLR